MTADHSTRIQKILVVDDNSANRELAEALLVSAGYAVVLAENGEEGITTLVERSPDLVLLDILMPGLDGFETCKRMKRLAAGKDTPVVFLTALGDLGSHQKAIDSGADDFLTKPINRTELLIRVRSLLWVKRLKDELSQGYDLIRSQHDALLQVQRQKEELSALVVHDLKSPLAVILANAQYLRDAAHDEEERGAMADILSSAESMHRMVMNLLDISRSEEGSLVPKLSEVDLGDLVKDVCGAARHRSEGRRLKLSHEVVAATVKADQDLLRRLIENLLDNSIKYTPAGGSVQIRVQLVDGGAVEIRVNDEGLGVPEEYRQKIFEKYVQIDRDVAPLTRSSRGLGLAFCRLAAEAHGGKIWVEPNQPKGSSFCVRIPAGVA